MNELIRVEVEKAKTKIKDRKSDLSISDDRAFSYAILDNFFEVHDFGDQDDLVTDGSNDGGIDFLYYDEDESKVVLCQAKYTSNLSYEDIGNEFDKMNSTLENFKIGNTGSYNDKLRRALQNALDRLPDDAQGNIIFNLYTIADVDVDIALKKLNNTSHKFSTDIVNIYQQTDIANQIQENQEKLDIVAYEKIKIDRAKNVLEYESEEVRGIMVNILSTSLVGLYNKYSKRGLFDLNIRRYINNKMVDSRINETLDKCREEFWFLNNGIIIACEDFDVDGNTVALMGFSIVNGGQTTTLIGKYQGDNKKEFAIPCKIVARKDKDKDEKKDKKKDEDKSLLFFTRIAEATNSQKPILPRDLKSNSPEMIRLARSLQNEKIYLEIKRGVKPTFDYQYSIKNDELAQLILSMVQQKPGTARSSKKVVFENPDTYSKIFKVNYDKDANKKGFLIDVVKLNDRYATIVKKLIEDKLTDIEVEVLKNGKQIIFALFGVLYMMANNDVSERDIIKDRYVVKNSQFTYGAFISNYTGDDIDEKLENLIVILVQAMTESYEIAFENKQATSVSNHFKTDAKYTDQILKKFVDYLTRRSGNEIKAQYNIFKR